MKIWMKEITHPWIESLKLFLIRDVEIDGWSRPLRSTDAIHQLIQDTTHGHLGLLGEQLILQENCGE